MAVLEDTFRTVNDDWSTPKTVHERLGFWSPITVQHSLATLAKAGLIERREIPAHPFPRAEYRSNRGAWLLLLKHLLHQFPLN